MYIRKWPKNTPEKFWGQGKSGGRDIGAQNFQGGRWDVTSTDDEAQTESQKFWSPISQLPDLHWPQNLLRVFQGHFLMYVPEKIDQIFFGGLYHFLVFFQGYYKGK